MSNASTPVAARSPLPIVKITVDIAIAVSILFALEALARVVKTIESDVRGAHAGRGVLHPAFAGSPTLGWVRRPGFRGVAEATHLREFDEEGYYTIDTAQVADAAIPKIVFIGDSNAFGFDVPTDASFVEVADRLLPGAHAINLGVPGYSSYQGLLVARAYIPALKPRLAVISFNFNDRRRAPSIDSPQRFEALYRGSTDYWPRRLASSLDHLYLFRGLQRVRRFVAGPAHESEPAILDLEEAAPRVSESAYRENLSDIAKLCLAHDTLPVFVLLRDNPAEAEPLRQGIEWLAQDRPSEAIDAFEAVVEQDSFLTDLGLIHLATALRTIGQGGRADGLVEAEALPMAPDGHRLVRLDTDYNRIMTEVAREHGAVLVDAASVIESVPGVFIDTTHFNVEGHRRVGELLAARLSPLLQEVAFRRRDVR
jgi:lysophospholipase L1-like esterase